MFGHDKHDETEDNTVPVTVNNAAPADPQPQDELTLPQPVADAPDPMATTAPAVDDSATATDTSTAEPIPQPIAAPAPAMEVSTADLPPDTINITSSGTMDNLQVLKQEALHELSPLIGQLDQTPEEKYETAKMIYDETHDQNMLSTVYEAAKNLTDDKAKAEAIYDVIKRINNIH